MDSVTVSWVLYAIRETLGLEDVRNMILKNKTNNDDIEYGPTFTLSNTYDDIYKTVLDFIRDSTKQYMVFTANGSVRFNKKKRVRYTNDLESHYLSFIVNKTDKIVLMVDPARDNGKPGIYNPYIGIKLAPFFKNLKFDVKWLHLSNPCQQKYHDVFCQSWSLYLTIKWFEWLGFINDVTIPNSQNEKYSELLRFYKNLLCYSKFKEELIESYNKSIENHTDYDELKKYNPCEILKNMSYNDMYD